MTTLMLTAITIGLLHTLMGPDHYVPFIAMARARNWSAPRTAWVTILCGLGHVGSSVVLGLIGVSLGITVARLEAMESARGNLAAWALIAFGMVYCAWGLRKAGKHVSLPHDHGVGSHTHAHDGHRHASGELTPWVLFTVFVFGPCEPLIPLLMYPAAKSDFWAVVLVAAVFGAVTIGTMVAVVMAACLGLRPLAIGALSRYGHAMAGATVLLCGIAIKMGL